MIKKRREHRRFFGKTKNEQVFFDSPEPTAAFLPLVADFFSSLPAANEYCEDLIRAVSPQAERYNQPGDETAPAG